MRSAAGETFEVDWGWANPGAKVLPGPCSFRSSRFNYYQLDEGLIGEIPNVRYPRSKYTPQSWQLGEHYCGTPEQWSGGYPAGTPGPPLDPSGIPVCCGGQGNLFPKGGGSGGGGAEWSVSYLYSPEGGGSGGGFFLGPWILPIYPTGGGKGGGSVTFSTNLVLSAKGGGFGGGIGGPSGPDWFPKGGGFGGGIGGPIGADFRAFAGAMGGGKGSAVIVAPAMGGGGLGGGNANPPNSFIYPKGGGEGGGKNP